jgi:dipeptidase
MAPSRNFSPDYHRGIDGAEPYPLWIKPDRKLTVSDVFALMRDHYEGTDYDMTAGVDAGPFGYPVRWRPMVFEVDGRQYTWERPISTHQTGFSMVTQARAWLPNPVGGLTWYGLDDTDFTCYVPIYSGITEIPRSYATGGLGRFDWDSAWWVFNFVSNYTALRYDDMIRDVRAVQAEIEGSLLALQGPVEKTAAELYETDPELMVLYLTDYSVHHAEDVVRKWRELGEHLLTKYNDGYVRDGNGRPQEQGYPESWLRKVVEERSEQYLLPEAEGRAEEPEDY